MDGRTHEVVNRAPLDARTPEGTIPSYGRGEVSHQFWKTKSQKYLMPVDKFEERLRQYDRKKLELEAKRADVPMLDDEEDLRDALLLRIKANTVDPEGTYRELFASWKYQDMQSRVSELGEAEAPGPPSRKSEILIDYLAVYHGEPETKEG